jgi:hypothetical protein
MSLVELYSIICDDCNTNKKEIKRNKINIFPAKLANALNFNDVKYHCSLVYYTTIIDLLLKNLIHPDMANTIEIFKYLALIEKHKYMNHMYDKIYRELRIFKDALFDRTINAKILYKAYEPVFYHIIKKLNIPINDKISLISNLSKVFYMSKCIESEEDMFHILKPNTTRFNINMNNSIIFIKETFRSNNLLSEKIIQLFA